jgi:DNA-binding transcriptional ArsR family regulator
MLRIHFTTEDLTRVRVARGPDLLWEIANSMQTLQRCDGRPAFGVWRRQVRPRLAGESRARAVSELLAPMLPPHGYSPDFLTAAPGDHGTLGAAVDAVLSTPRSRLRADLAVMAGGHRLPGATEALAYGERAALRALGDAFAGYFRRAIDPYWHSVHSHIDADCALRLRTFQEGGTEGLLNGLGPQFRWRPPVLEVDYPVTRELQLGGRGLTLQPSFFCWPTPVSLADPGLTPVLVHPIRHEADWLPEPEAERRRAAAREGALSALLGRTRAALLRAALTGGSTKELARRLDVTGPAISQHTAVLREAGLLTTVRRSGRTLHTTTAEGRALLRSTDDEDRR